MTRTVKPSRKPERLRDDRCALDALLDEIWVGYVGLSLAEGPLVLPVSFARDGDRVLLHGSTGSHRMRALADGAEICFTVAVADALKVGRSAFGTGMRYRSAVIFGQCQQLTGDDLSAGLLSYLDRYLPGRSGEVRPMTDKERSATMLLALPINNWTMKVADGFPVDDSEDRESQSWAGIVPLIQAVGVPVPNPDLGESISLPSSVRNLIGR